MLKALKPTLSLLLAVSAMCIVSSCSNDKKETTSTGTYASTPAASCGCDSIWFPHATTPPPMEGIGSPFDTSSTTNCMFHQWSWQKFLWLTRPVVGGHAFFQDSLIQVDAQLASVTPYNKIPLVLEDTAQAGSGGSLNTNPAFAGDKKTNLVYYSIYVNNTLMDASVAFKKAIGKDTAKLTNLDMFPIGSLELKVSWVNVNAIPEAQRANYYTAEAAIKSGSGYQPTTVALLGMHVVGRVINHPEFIWATFEHHGMAPYYDWKTTTSTQDSPVTSDDEKLLFAKGSTTTLGGITWGTVAPTIPYKVFTLYKYGVPRTALDSFMTGTCQSEPLNYDNIDGLNTCVAANLDKSDVWRNYFYNGSIWVNMDGLNDEQQAQLIVSQGSNIGDAQTGGVVRGSLNAFNLTMETYVQTGANDSVNNIHNIGVGDLTNCFSCHTGAPFSLSFNGKKYKNQTSPLYVSHIFRNYMGTGGRTTLKDAKLQGVKDFVEGLNVKNMRKKK